MYIYDTHVHTMECSACARSDARETVRAYKAAGFSGFVLTNHFYRGNTRIDRSLSWEEFVKPYYDAYLEAKDEGDKLDFDVIFGIEEYVGQHKEYLLYNIDLEFLLANPDMPNIDGEELARRVHAAGGYVSFAHPYRFRESYMNAFFKPDFSHVDAVEVINACNKPEENEKALAAARELSLTFTCGSDTHSVSQANNGDVVGMVFKNRVKTGAELVAALQEPAAKAYIKGKILSLDEL